MSKKLQTQNVRITTVRNVHRKHGTIFHPTPGYAIPPPIPLTVARRNVRERNRLKTVNDSYECLRAHVPVAAKAKRMAKVDIIKHTIDYIQKLQRLVSSIEGPNSDQFPQTNQRLQDDRILSSQFVSSGSTPSTPFSSIPPSCNSSSYSPSCESGYSSPGQYHENKQTMHAAGYSVWKHGHNSACDSFPVDDDVLEAMVDDEVLDAIAEWQTT